MQEYFNNLIYTQLRSDLHPIPNEQKKIINNMIILNELPYYPNKVILDDEDMVEIDIRQPITNTNQYKVDYNVATVYFHPDRENQTMNMTYIGKGLILIDGSRVVTLYENGTIKETLNQLADDMRQATQDALDLQNSISETITNLSNQIQSNEETRQDNESVRLVNETVRQDLYTQVKTETLMIYKDSVTTYSAIATTYPNPQEGWVVQTINDTGRPIYRYNGTQWVNMGSYFNSGDIVVSTSQPTTVNNMWIKKI